jgi:type IV pilus assembly protein PilY1
VTRGPKGQGLTILFGTGKFMEQVDKKPTQTQSFYGVIDQNTGVTATDAFTMASARTVMTQQQILGQGPFTFTSKATGKPVTVSLRVTSDNALGTNRGWYMDFLDPPTPGTFVGEMQVSNSVLRNGRIVFTTLIPDADPCSAGGSSWLMEMDALSGSRLTESPFDPNEDGVFSETDWVTITLPDGSKITVPASGIGSEVGIAQGPGILFDPGNGSGGAKEYKYLSGSSANSSGSNLQRVIENPGPNSNGRQSWRQLK